MAKSAVSLSFLSLVFWLLLLIFFSGGILKPANAEEKTWCVAKPSASDAELATNIQYACDHVMDQCLIFAEGGPCYHPNTSINHASVAMNLYYQFAGRNAWNCDFRATGLITTTNPSYGNCNYA